MKYILFILFFPLCAFGAESVYCIHGFMRKPTCMKKMAAAFEKDYEVVRWGYPSREKTVEEHAENLVLELQKTANRHPGEPIHFVTHSLGGIVLRSTLNHPECPIEAKQGKAVLMAPPNGGAALGRFLGKIAPMRKVLGSRSGEQLMRLESFEHLGSFPESKKVLVIAGTYGFNPILDGKNDGKVSVAETCLPTPHKHVTHFAGHSWIMYSDTVIQFAHEFITSQ